MEGIICQKCGVIKFEKEDINNIEEFGKCLVCEKLEGEYQEEMRSEVISDEDEDYFAR